MTNKKGNLGRRGFLRSAAAGAAVLAASQTTTAVAQRPRGGQNTVLIVGGGIAGLSAALTLREAGVDVILIERASREERGGNTRFSNGAIRAVAEPGTPGLSREQFLDDLVRVTQGRTDRELAGIFADRSGDTLTWLMDHGVVPFARSRGTWNQGAAISDVLFDVAEKAGVDIRYGVRAESLIEDDGGVSGVRVISGRERSEISAAAVVLAAGGFESNPELRARYIGPGWDLAKVRGCRYNTGDGLRMAMDIGAMPYGHWSGCHTTNWDMNAPDQNTLDLTTVFKRDSFNYGIIVNQNGDRFLDEGEDVSGLIYAKLGAVIMEQPGRIAFQIYDSKTIDFLPPEYHAEASTRATADTLEELAEQMPGLNRERFLTTVAEYNAAIREDIPFDSFVKDGRSTAGLATNKTNWATAIDTPPYEAYGVTAGITFTFGGLRIDRDARVLDVDGHAIPRLYAAGEMVGGLFYFNYPGGCGLSSSAVFGRIAGVTAAAELGRTRSG